MTVDKLQTYGLSELSDDQIADFLRNQGYGVLGLPTADLPYLIPMSFGYDGADRLYFSFFVEGDSRKDDLAAATDRATFLVYSADAPFMWESVQLRGSLTEVSPSEWERHEAAMENAWYLDLFEQADEPGTLRLYEFRIRDRSGFAYAGRPPGVPAAEEHGED